MSDILLGVIIGGLIASITPIVMIILDHRRWQRQSKPEQQESAGKSFLKNEGTGKCCGIFHTAGQTRQF
jgi:hypothetical protein